jgi:hypothetical protein
MRAMVGAVVAARMPMLMLDMCLISLGLLAQYLIGILVLDGPQPPFQPQEERRRKAGGEKANNQHVQARGVHGCEQEWQDRRHRKVPALMHGAAKDRKPASVN